MRAMLGATPGARLAAKAAVDLKPAEAAAIRLGITHRGLKRSGQTSFGQPIDVSQWKTFANRAGWSMPAQFKSNEQVSKRNYLKNHSDALRFARITATVSDSCDPFLRCCYFQLG
jgi:hypothetical protein